MNPAIYKKISLCVLLALLLPALAGCFGVAVVGMGASALMLSDRRPSETYVTDQGIELRAGNSISEKYHDRVHVNVTSYNRMVLITGEVPDAATKADVEQIVAGKPNVKATQNELKISGLSALGGRSNDSLITSKVKGRFIDYGKFSANIVKVVTENGTVYLMGLVTQREADAATQIARETSGVLGVVRLFEYLTEQDAARLDNRPPGASKP
ncbi:MAG: BON domain-containing protein [Verrucomicrobia bacterium]|nr:MAG: BON domain-containing protein [Verrucomicrobiota bacterium]